MTFNVNYSLKTGIIDSFQDLGTDADNLCPDGCATLSFPAVFPQLWDNQGNLVMKVDLKTKLLVLINPVVLPQGTEV